MLAQDGVGEASALSLSASGEAKPTGTAASKRRPSQLVLVQHCTGTRGCGGDGGDRGTGMLRAQADGWRGESDAGGEGKAMLE